MTEELRVSEFNQDQSSGHRGHQKTDVYKVYKDRPQIDTGIGLDAGS